MVQTVWKSESGKSSKSGFKEAPQNQFLDHFEALKREFSSVLLAIFSQRLGNASGF